jgi:hypothetical protein
MQPPCRALGSIFLLWMAAVQVSQAYSTIRAPADCTPGVTCDFFFSWIIPDADTSLVAFSFNVKSDGWAGIGFSKAVRHVCFSVCVFSSHACARTPRAMTCVSDSLKSLLCLLDMQSDMFDSDIMSVAVDATSGVPTVYNRHTTSYNTPPVGKAVFVCFVCWQSFSCAYGL